MGTLRKLWRKMRRWFDRKGKKHIDDAKDIIKDAFNDMDIPVADLFDDGKRDRIADELKLRVKALKDDLTEWVIELALESLWAEVQRGFFARRNKG